MNGSKYKTVFVNTVSVGKGLRWKCSVNGNQLARDIQATIEEMELDDYILDKMEEVSAYKAAGYNTTEGMLLVFKKE